MPSYRFPILVWDHAAGVTACLVEEAGDPSSATAVAAMAATKSAAIEQLKAMLQWRYRKHPWARKPDFTEPVLSWVKVEVRPEYRSEERVFPCREMVVLRVPCVRGKDKSGLGVCSMPTLGVRFQFDDEAALPQLAGHYVQLELKGQTPRQLARHLPPRSAELEDVVIQVPAEPPGREPPPDLTPLPAVADPLGQRSGRGRLSRPWQRDEQVSRLAQALSRERGSVLLLGESGAGKTAVLAEAVRKVERGAIEAQPAGNGQTAEPPGPEPATRVRKRFWLTSASRLIAGMQYLGQWQQRCEEIVAKLDEIGGVLCVERLLDLLRVGASSPGDSIAAFLVPYLQRGELRLVGEATSAELDACRRLLPAFAAIFTVVEIPAFTPGQAVEALDQLAGSWGRNLKVAHDRSAIEHIYRLFARFMPYQSFPGRAAGFVTELFDRVSRTQGASVTSQSVIDRFIKLTGLPELFLRDDRVLEYEQVVRSFSEKVIGQDAACRTAAAVVTTFKAALNDPHRPLGVLLFCGPTGVGKTELARTISEYLFGHGEKKDRMVRLDMSEYAGPGAAERLIGSAGGKPSPLIQRVRDEPFTVVLLDEIEKAAPEVFDVLLGVFDEGRLTDRYGRLTVFRSALIVMTSNLGADRNEPFGLSALPVSEYDAEVAAFFRPEFFNRIDAVVTFDPLSAESIRKITAGELQKVAEREGIRQRGISLRWTDAVVNMLCEIGYDRQYGARPLQRAIENMVVTPLARLLVDRPALKDVMLTPQIDETGELRFDAGE
jgi:ATP-dependent Clp protease ATP-binding subunit ClpC